MGGVNTQGNWFEKRRVLAISIPSSHVQFWDLRCNMYKECIVCVFGEMLALLAHKRQGEVPHSVLPASRPSRLFLSEEDAFVDCVCLKRAILELYGAGAHPIADDRR